MVTNFFFKNRFFDGGAKADDQGQNEGYQTNSPGEVNKYTKYEICSNNGFEAIKESNVCGGGGGGGVLNPPENNKHPLRWGMLNY